ncbi:hypothetical protein ACFSTE_11400 [Aquimarina hainanensis]|uniref:Uncharacterized protein n=1 Tax=Aquimarina hainanensis TaxID=1578017 RepID=A0ABW5N8T2_9FLAO|nr:hypothetical protein [Aquimarina sp. TRL1]QKX05428.1 hypothetical protein HN014_11045 [Aquimarina sp. TRL1]
MKNTLKKELDNDILETVIAAAIVYAGIYIASTVIGPLTAYINSKIENRNFILQEITVTPTGLNFVFKRDQNVNNDFLTNDLHKEALAVTEEALSSLVKEGKITSFKIL